ncbi:hypothetical protein [Actibacterium ureilyticum]|uniref:hypothetical protein n=1 Tax=Actibacterium ureilyticum TaxID=1590614 RepID=UPI000BAAD1DE|nr:hypothetical protein [Actibacterium ureilyticum]
MAKTVGREKIHQGGATFILEEPTRAVLRDALFYVMFRSTTGPVMGMEFNRDYAQFSVLQEGWGKDSPHRHWQDLPAEIGEWQLEILHFDIEDFAPFLTDVRVRRDRWHWMTDISEGNHAMVRPAVKAVIEELDREVNYFVPMKVFDKDSGDLISDEYHYWIPRRRFWFLPSQRRGDDQRMTVPFTGSFSRTDAAWELANNTALREYVKNIPFWGLHIRLSDIAFSSSAFHRMKSEGFSGLVENTATAMWDQDLNQNIGHF